MANNGTALAIHESKLLWPDVPFQCVVSLGTGQHLPSTEYSSTKLALKDKVMKIVDSATDTEGELAYQVKTALMKIVNSELAYQVKTALMKIVNSELAYQVKTALI